MRVAAKSWTARESGRAYEVRSARPKESGRILDHLWRVHECEPGVQVEDPDEFPVTVESLKSLLEHFERSKNGFFLVAAAADEIAGSLNVRGGRHRKLRHVGELGMSVRDTWRREGVGRCLLDTAIETARKSGTLRVLSLQVFETNLPAIRLYETAGFSLDGRRPGHLLIDGAYRDLLVMSLDLGA